jgi:hypothetical protein
MPKHRAELTGKRFGRLFIVERAQYSPSGWLWRCLCDCGTCCFVKTGLLTTRNTKSCGCLRREMVAAKNYRHGLLKRGKQSPEFYAYLNAKSRCEKPNNKYYSRYGGRGIKFRFANFDQFFSVLGRRPTPSHSVDRVNNDGHYEPGNVRWATRSQQQRNRRHNSRTGHQGFMTREETRRGV